MSSSSSGSFSLIFTAAVVCLENTTANPLFTFDSATQFDTQSVMSMNSGASLVLTLRLNDLAFMFRVLYPRPSPAGCVQAAPSSRYSYSGLDSAMARAKRPSASRGQ